MPELDISAEVQAIVARLARREADALSLDASWRTLGIDSLDLLEVVLACEQRFGISIPDEQTIGLHTPRDVIAYISAQTALNA